LSAASLQFEDFFTVLSAFMRKYSFHINRKPVSDEFLAERYYVAFGLWQRPSVCRLSPFDKQHVIPSGVA